MSICFLLSALCLLLSAYCLLLSAYWRLPTAYCPLPTAFCLLPIATATSDARVAQLTHVRRLHVQCWTKQAHGAVVR
jgi:hypothetical protein